MNSQSPGFSVVVPLYNKMPQIGSTLKSVMAQSIQDFEIVVVDDGSLDGGADYVASLAEPRLRLVRQPNRGVSEARNRGVAEARGALIAFLDADDLYLPGFLEAIEQMAQRFPEAGAYATRHILRWEDGYEVMPTAVGFRTEEPRLIGNFYESWARSPLFCASSICVRREVLLELGTVFPRGEEHQGEDQDAWFRIAERHPVAYTKRPCVIYRRSRAKEESAPSIQEEQPFIRRLSTRVASGEIRPEFRRGARRVVAVHLLGVAWNRIAAGSRRGAFPVLRDRRTFALPLYWLRCAAAMLLPVAVLSRARYWYGRFNRAGSGRWRQRQS